MRNFLRSICILLIFATLQSNVKAQTTLVAGDIAFTGYISSATNVDSFSFVLLKNVTTGTVINFTDNGWLSTNVFRSGEQTTTWTSTAALSAGTEILISGTTSPSPLVASATLVGGASAGTCTGTMLSLSTSGDQILAYQGTAGSPTFISAIHMNVYQSTAPINDPVSTTAAAWDGTANTTNSSSLPTGLTTGTNCIWIGTQDVSASEDDNAKFVCGPDVSTAALARAALNNKANWFSEDGGPTIAIPTGCNYIAGLPAPIFTTNPPATITLCELANTSITVAASNAASYQWQVDNGGGFVNIVNNTTYSGATTAILNINAAPISLNGYIYRCVATNGTGSVNSTNGTLTVTALPISPSILAKTPATATVADGTPVSATFNAGSGGTGCADDFRYTTNNGASYLPYTPGSNISTTGLAAGSGTVFIEGRRANCSAGCQGTYVVLASWVVTPLPAGATTLNAGDIAFSGYTSTSTNDDFSFVLLRNIGSGTTINFTNNGWLSTNVFRTGEETVTWTSNAAYPAGTEIKISGLTSTLVAGGSAGTVTGTALNLSTSGDQILAYRGSAAAPTFITAIHHNVLSTTIGDAVSTTAAAWDGTANSANASALPTGLTTGTNAIWIGVQDIPSSEFNNSKFGLCNLPAVTGPVNTLRAALNNQANWTKDNSTPPSFTLPTGCNYLSALAPTINVTGTPLTAFTSCAGTASAEQSFTVDGSGLTANIIITAPAGFEISTTSGSGFTTSITLTQSGGTVPSTPIYVRLAASATGTPSGDITIASTGVTTVNVAVSGTVNPLPAAPTITAGGPTTFCAGGSVVLTSSSATGNTWSTGETTQSITVTTSGTYTVTVTSSGCTSTPSAGTNVTVNPIPPTPTITAGGPTTFCVGGSVVLTSSSATGNTWSTGETTQSITVTTAGSYTVTVTLSGCTSAPSAATTVTVDALPTTSNAGPDGTACASPGTFTMAANVPTVGTGSWSQAPGGPATAIIFTSGSASTNIGGLTTAGVYTFVWTISSGSCPPSRDTMTITVNTNPAPFTLTGGGTFCPGTTTLTGPVDPNYTYTWQRSLSGIANPNSFTTFGGTASTQDVTSSGNYRLIVTNQFGCATSDTTPVSKADFVFNGSLAAGDAQQTGRLNRFATLSTCAAPKTCPLTFTTTGARFYDSYNITNPRSVPVCATIGLRSDCGTSLFNVAYLGSFNPTSLCTNYLADPGSSFPGTGYMEVTIPANATIVVVVHEVNPATGCASYQLTVDVPRETGITVNPSTPICSATPVTLTAPLASSYSWNPGGNTTQAITVTPAATTEYFVTLGYGNVGCTTVDSATVTISPLPTTANAGVDASVCGLTYTLTGNAPTVGTGTWTLVTGPGIVNFNNANDPVATATASINGIYTLRWTIATGAPCPNSSQDDVVVNFAGTPSVADAGLDKTACLSPARATMTAAVPTVGTGVWTQVAGPVTANIISPSAPNTIITGLNTLGTYTFRWTVSNNPCPSTFDEVNVVVNGNPASFTITGGGTFCPTGTTLAGPVDPNYTYQWGKSYLTTPFAGVGTAQTLAVTSSGIYELVVTNQFGCATSATTVVNAADYVFTGSLTGTDAQQTGRLNRFASISTCAAPKACPGIFTTAGSRAYDSYTITNPRPVPVCAVIGLNSGCGTAIFSAAYTGSYDPNAQCTNYLADPGSSPSSSIFYEATIPANGTIVIVVHEVNPGQGCANYSLTVDVPRDASPIIATPPTVTCASTTTLTAPVANSYSWNPGGATTRSIVTPPLFVDTKFYATMGYGNNGCNRLDSITVVVTSLPPTITCPANITQPNTTGQCGRVITYSTTVGGLPIPTETYTFTGATTGSGAGNGSGSFFNVGTTTVTVTATNACGSVNCSFTVTINDTQAPTVTVGTIGSCYPTVAAAQAAALAATSATDNCPGVLTEAASTVGTCSAVITVTTTDAAGNSTDVTYNTRIDNTAPTVTVGTIASCYPTVAAAEAAALAATSATDNCPGALTEVASTVGTCSAVITVTTTDGCGNATAVTYNTRIDNTAPTVIVGTIASCYPTVAAAEAAALAATSATDNCPGALTEVASTVGTCSAVITVTTTDGCGNATAVTYNTRIDNIPPVITCPAAITVCSAAGVPAANISLVTATDNCTGAITIIHVSDISTPSTTVPYIITRTYRATDGCGNFAECTQLITVNPIPNAVATPSSQTICSANPITTIILTGNVPGTVYNWSRNNSATVTGIAASGTGDIAGTLTNTTFAPVTVTFTITPTFTNAGTTCTGTSITATVLVNPTPNAIATPASQTICSGNTITPIVLTSNVTGTTFAWTRDNTATVTGIAASGSGNISGALTNTTPLPVTVTFTITPTSPQGCVGPTTTATVLVNPRPVMTATPAAQTICNGVTITPIVFASTTPGTTYTWTRDNSSGTTAPGGIQANGSGPSITGFMINTTNAPILVTFTITPTAAGCVGTPVTATVLIQPTTTAIATPATQINCSGSPIATISLTSPVVGTVYNWTRDNVALATGIAATGTGNISGTLTTTSATPVVVTFTITPSINGCTGPAIIAIDTVKPTPTVTQPANQTLCNGAVTTAINFTGTVAGTVFNWTNNTPSIGLAASGTGNIAAFTAVNNTSAPITATITVTPAAAGCTGVARTFTITINPTANVNSVANQTLCTGATTTAINFTGTVTGTTFSWTNNTPSIGLAASGTGNIPAFTAINTTPNAVTATITVTPNTASGCVGTPTTFTITVNGNSVAPTGATSSVTTNCGPTITTLSVQGGALGTGATWKWYTGSCGGTLIGTGATLSNVAVNTTTTYYVRAEGTCNTTVCASVTVTVNTQPIIGIAAAPTLSLTPLTSTTITASITPSIGTNTIEWYKNGVLVTGATANQLLVNVDQLGSYTARVTTAQGCTALSNAVVINAAKLDNVFVYPNPNNGQFKIRYYSGATNFGFLRSVIIYDSKGAKIYSKAIPITAPYSTMDIDIRNYPKGIYMVVIGDDRGNQIVQAKVEVLH